MAAVEGSFVCRLSFGVGCPDLLVIGVLWQEVPLQSWKPGLEVSVLQRDVRAYTSSTVDGCAIIQQCFEYLLLGYREH